MKGEELTLIRMKGFVSLIIFIIIFIFCRDFYVFFFS